MTGVNQRTNFGRSLGKTVSNWVVLVLILLFALLSIAMTALGTQAYRSIDKASKENGQLRTAVGYITNRVRAFDGRAKMRVDHVSLTQESIDVLVFSEEIDGEVYETRLFCAGGELREQFVSADIPLEHETDGERIAQMNRFLIIIDDHLLTFELTTPDGTTEVVHTALRSA